MNKLRAIASSLAALLAAYAAFGTKSSATPPAAPQSDTKLRADVNSALNILTDFSKKGLPNGSDIIMFCMCAVVSPKTPQGMRIAAAMWLAATAWKLGFHGNTHIQTVVEIGAEIQKQIEDFPPLKDIAAKYNSALVESQRVIDAKNQEYDKAMSGPVLTELVKLSLG